MKVEAMYTITSSDGTHDKYPFIEKTVYDAEKSKKNRQWWLVTDEYGDKQLFTDDRFRKSFRIMT